MAKLIGVNLSDRILAGLVIDHKLVGELHSFPKNRDQEDALVELPTEDLVRTVCEEIVAVAQGAKDFDRSKADPSLRKPTRSAKTALRSG